MNSQMLIILVGLLYIVIVGGISLIRRESLSGQFAFEALVVIGAALLVGSATGTAVDPIILVIILYLVTMRARLLTDLANLLLKRSGYRSAERLYRFALGLFPDRGSRFIVLINWGIARLHIRDIEGAIATLSEVLQSAGEGDGLGHKYEAACRYNLAVAYRKAGDDAKAVVQFNQVTELFPASVYGQAAERALKKKRERTTAEDDTHRSRRGR